MEILLIAPPRPIPQKSDFPPIGLAYISAALRGEGIDVRVLDASAFSWKTLAEPLRLHSPSVVGISCWTLERGQVFKTAKLVKEILPKAKIVLGGHHATAFPEHMFINAYADAVVIGEGEETALELFRAMLTRQSLENIRGIAYSENGRIHLTEHRDLIINLDLIPYPDYADFNLDDYLGLPEIKGRAASIMTSRGCPYRCIFCSGSKFWERRWRSRSPENVLGEIEWLYYDQKVRNFIFFDDNFTVQKDRAIQICQGIIDRKLDIHFVASSHVAHIDKELLYWMKRGGCYRIDFGVESGTPEILDKIKKSQTVEQIEQTFELVHEAGIKPRAFLIVGSPGENEKTIDQTVSLMRRIKPYDSRTAEIMWVLPNTEIYELAKTQGLLTDDFWLKNNETLYYTCEHTLDELKLLRDHLMKETSRNEGTIKAYLEYLARKAYYNYPLLQRLRGLRKVFK